MAKQIYVVQPVKDLEKSKDFWTELGFTFNPKMTDEKAACMIIEENIFVMLIIETFFKTFTEKKIVDAHTSIERSVTISADSKETVNEIVEKAESMGAVIPNPATDYGFMYQHSFGDLDGHHWEFMWVDPNGVPEKPANS